MYLIDSGFEVPDIEYMHRRMSDSMDRGVALRNMGVLRSEFIKCKATALQTLQDSYKIMNPNSSAQILQYFDKRMKMSIERGITERGLGIDIPEVINFLLYGYAKGDVINTDYDKLILFKDTSDKQNLCEFLDELVNNPIYKYMYNGEKWTTDKAAMKAMALEGRQDALDILTYRKAKKYLECIESFSNAICGDGLVHPTISRSKTNRVTYSNPALLNIPKQLLWNMVGPRRPGNTLISVDIKNQEPWVLINMLGIDELKYVIENFDDLYSGVFEVIFDRAPEPIERREIKLAWNALTYGASIKALEKGCQNIDYKAVYKYFNGFQEFKRYKAKCRAMAKAGAQIATTYFGTELYADAYGSKLQRVLMDIGIQGTGSDIMALLIKHFDAERRARELEDAMDIYFTRYDEAVVEAEQEYVHSVGVEEVIETLRDIFEHRIDDWEPFKVEIKILGEEVSFIDSLKVASLEGEDGDQED